MLKGHGAAVDPPLVEGALCYETDLFDAKTNILIGDGVDCLANIEAIGDGFLIDRTTFLNMPQGRVVANGMTTVKPVVGGSPDFTHIVGDIPATDANSFVEGLSTGIFEGATGRVRLSGAVNMADFSNSIEFNCIFVIDVAPSVSAPTAQPETPSVGGTTLSTSAAALAGVVGLSLVIGGGLLIRRRYKA